MAKRDIEHASVPESYYQLQMRFGKALYGKGPVGEAFRHLCEKGCDPSQLQRDVFKLSRYPRRKAEKEYKAKDLLKLKTIAEKLEKAAKELQPFEDLLFQESFAGLNFQRKFLNWERPIEIPKTLHRLSDRLKQCSESARRSDRSVPNVYQRIPAIVESIRKATGRPHYAELATLIGFAIARPSLSAEEVKMICFRRRANPHTR